MNRVSKITLILFSIPLSSVYGQVSNHYSFKNNAFQYGITAKATLEIGTRKSSKSNFRIAANAGVASNFLGDWSHPALNVEFRLFSKGMGSRQLNEDKNSPLVFEVITSLQMTAGTNNRMNQSELGFWEKRYVPLAYFADEVDPALQNPFAWSLSLGTNIVMSTDPLRQTQRVGFLGLNFGRTIQFNYYNDGGPGLKQLGLGDGKDRNYTGGGYLGFTGKQRSVVNSIRIGYQKFTGFGLNAFEAADKMSMAYVDYQDPQQADYNKSLFYASAVSQKYGVAASYKFYNSTKADGQHYIHWQTSSALHLVPDHYYEAVAISYFFTKSNYGIR